MDNELREVLKSLPERKRRTFLRYLNDKSRSANKEGDNSHEQTQKDHKEDLMKKLAELKLASMGEDEEEDDFSDEFAFDNEDSEIDSDSS